MPVPDDPLACSRNTPTPLVPPAGGRDLKAKPAHPPVEDLLRHGHTVMVDLDIHISARRLHRVVRRFIRETGAEVDFLTWLTYADPTGETAVRNVAGDGGKR